MVRDGLRAVESGACSCGVDLLAGALRRRTERSAVVGDLVAVAVGRNRTGGAPPRLPLLRLLGFGAEFRGPRLVVGEGAVEHGIGALLAEVAALVQGLAHLVGRRPARLGGHGAGGFGDQPCDETRCLSGAAGADGSGGGVGEAVVDDGGDVVGVAEPARLDEAWQEGVDVVVVGFSPAQFRGQGAEGVGVDHGLRLLVGEPGAADQGGPAVVLGCGGDGFVFGGELGDRAPPVLLGGDWTAECFSDSACFVFQAALVKSRNSRSTSFGVR